MPTDADEMERQRAAQIERSPPGEGVEPAQAQGEATSILRGRQQGAEAPAQGLPSAQQGQQHPPPLATRGTPQVQPAVGLHHRPPPPPNTHSTAERERIANVIHQVSQNQASVALMAEFARYWRNPRLRAEIEAAGHAYVVGGRRDWAVYLTAACWIVAGLDPLGGFPPDTHDVIARFLFLGSNRIEIDRLRPFAPSICAAGPQDAPPARPPTQHQAAARTRELAEPITAADLEAAANNFQETAARTLALANRYRALAMHQADEEARAAAQRFNVAIQPPRTNVFPSQTAALSRSHSQTQEAGFGARGGTSPQAASFGASRPTLPRGAVQLEASARPRAADGNPTLPSQHQGTDPHRAALEAQMVVRAQRQIQLQAYHQAQAQAQAQRQDQSQRPAPPQGRGPPHGTVQLQQAAHMQGLAQPQEAAQQQAPGQPQGAAPPQGAALPQRGSQSQRTVRPQETTQSQEEAQPRVPAQGQGSAPPEENSAGQDPRRGGGAKRNQPEGSRAQPRRSTRIRDAEQAGSAQAGAAIVSPSCSASGYKGEPATAASPHRTRGQAAASQ